MLSLILPFFPPSSTRVGFNSSENNIIILLENNLTGIRKWTAFYRPAKEAVSVELLYIDGRNHYIYDTIWELSPPPEPQVELGWM